MSNSNSNNNQIFNNKKFSDSQQSFENMGNVNKNNLKSLQNKQMDIPAKAFSKERGRVSKIYSPSLGINDMNEIMRLMNLNNEPINNQINLVGNNNSNIHNMSTNLNYDNKLICEEIASNNNNNPHNHNE